MFTYTLPTAEGLAKRLPGGGGSRHELRSGTSRFLAQRAFLFYKTVVTLYMLFWCIWWPVVDELRVTIFLSFWTFYTATVYFMVSTFAAICCHVAIEKERPRPAEPGLDPPPRDESTRITTPPVPSFFRWVQHVTWNISLVGSMVVVTVYFSSLHEGGTLSMVDINAHIALPAIMLFDMCFVASEYFCRSFWYAEYFGIIYLVFNLIWYYEGFPGERVVYPILDWKHNTDTAALYVFLILFVMIPVFATGFLLVYRAREWVYDTCFDRTEKPRKPRKPSRWIKRRPPQGQRQQQLATDVSHIMTVEA